jgi:hypothetical protein
MPEELALELVWVPGMKVQPEITTTINMIPRIANDFFMMLDCHLEGIYFL